MNATISQKKFILTLVGSPAEEETTRQRKWIQLKKNNKKNIGLHH